MNPVPARISSVRASKKHRAYLRAEAGVGLIEILIAVLVLSIGILGIAALQTRALANNSSSTARTMATIASYSILDAMRADRANALAGSYTTTVTVGSCPTTSGTLAQYQLMNWCQGSGSNPPDGLASLGTGTTGMITCAPALCTVTITYNDTRSGKGTNETTKQTVITQAVL